MWVLRVMVSVLKPGATFSTGLESAFDEISIKKAQETGKIKLARWTQSTEPQQVMEVSPSKSKLQDVYAEAYS